MNFIKAESLHTRQFKELCKDMNATHEILLFHRAVRWFSKGNVLNRNFAFPHRERERIYLICFAHRHNNQIDNTHKKKSLVAKAREHRGTFRLSSRDTP